MLFILKKVINYLARDVEQERIEKYLAQSHDIYDLEYRMKHLQENERQSLSKRY